MKNVWRFAYVYAFDRVRYVSFNEIENDVCAVKIYFV